MNILFITSNRLGDAVLSTGLLDYISQTYPESSVTIVCGSLPSSLFTAYPQLKEIIILKKQKHNKHWLDLWKRVIGTRWDIVIDLRDSAVSRLIWAGKRHIFSRQIDKSRHKVQQAAQLMGLDHSPAPKLWFTAEQNKKAATFIPDEKKGQVLGVGPTANWIGKTWPADNFIKVINAITANDGIIPDAHVAVFAAPGEEEGAYTVLNALPKNRQIDVIAKTDPGTAAATLARCDFYIGNDSGLMHCAAAAGVPTIGVFGPSYPHLYSPWGDHTDYAQTPQTFDELIDFPGYDPKTLDHSLMTSLTTDKVLDKINKLKAKD